MRKRCAAFVTAILMWSVLPAYSITISPPSLSQSERVIRLSGEIVEGDSKKLVSALGSEVNTAADIIQLDSIGGNVLEAEKAASIIRTGGLTVWVRRGDVCASACFLLFASGVKRIASNGSLIGVHSASIKGGEDIASLAVTTLIARDAKAYGVPDSIVGKIVSTEPGSITWLTASDLKQMNVQSDQSPSPIAKFGTDQVQQAEFKGSYVCVQGLTGMRLRVTRKTDEDSALFEFGAVPSNPNVPAGAFELKGHLNISTGSLYMIPTRWINRPGDYLMIGLIGSSNDGGLSFSGKIIGGVDCSGFKIVRVG